MSRAKTKFLVYIFIFLAAFSLLFSKTSFLNPLKYTVVKWSLKPAGLILAPVRELKKLLYYHRTFNEYIRLRREVDTLKGRLVGFEEISRENHRLARLLDVKRKSLYSSITAFVIGRDPSNWNSSMIIDKGTQDGIAVGQPVVNTLGVIGKVAEVSADTAKVILLTDPAFSVVALDQRSREVGLVSGTLRGVCRMRYLATDADVQVGDSVLTSKMSSSFPEGLLIGRITEIHRDNDRQTAHCLIQPAVALSQIEEVLVIRVK